MSKKPSRLFPALALAGLCNASLPAQPQPQYQVIPLTVMGSPWGGSAATGISPDGLVVTGAASPQTNGPPGAIRNRACCWINGHPHVLPRLNAPSLGLNNSAERVNAAGTIMGSQAVGNAFVDPIATHAVIWSQGVPIDLGALPGDGVSVGFDMNDHDAVVGISSPNSFHWFSRPFRWKNGQMSPLPMPVGDLEAMAFGINNAGAVVGTSGDLLGSPAEATPVLWENGVPSALPLPVGAPHGVARAINDSGVIGGIAGVFEGLDYNGESQPVRWDNGVPTYLPLPAGHNTGWVSSVNSKGDMVGSSGEFDLFRISDEPVLWTGGQAWLLRDITAPMPGWTWEFGTASQINDKGQIVGSATLNGKRVGFLALPVD